MAPFGLLTRSFVTRDVVDVTVVVVGGGVAWGGLVARAKKHLGAATEVMPPLLDIGARNNGAFTLRWRPWVWVYGMRGRSTALRNKRFAAKLVPALQATGYSSLV